MISSLGDSRLRDIQREYVDVLEKDELRKDIDAMVANEKTRLLVNINTLRRIAPERTARLVDSGFEELICFQRAIKQLIGSRDPNYSKSVEEFDVGFTGSFGSHHLTPRIICSKFLGRIICVEGIVTKCSLVVPKLLKSVHYCPAKKKITQRHYTDFTSLDPFPSTSVYPTRDDEGNLLETEYGLCSFQNFQTFTIQEMPEAAPPGQLPRFVDVVLTNDLADTCQAGDRVQVVGTYRCLPKKRNGYTNAWFKTVLIANSIRLISSHIDESLSLAAADVALVKRFNQQTKSVINSLVRSLAPSIRGMDQVKKAILCMLIGGVEKNLENGTRLRGDINILLVGDPSVAKSQLLRYVMHVAPTALCTTGRGSSGVGLTAAVTTDQATGERRLEAGAMVLADRGVVCIDEFDKMSDIDRTAIHEVMEQGKVTIAKAGIHASLNARCSVLAAANPVYGRYDKYKSPMDNIGLPDSLLSRFDLIFVLLDDVNPDNDKLIAEHVLRMHRYKDDRESIGSDLFSRGIMKAQNLTTFSGSRSNGPQDRYLAVNALEDEISNIFEKHDPSIQGSHQTVSDSEKILNISFLKSYLRIARMTRPTLTEEASNAIATEYASLRNFEAEGGGDRIARTQPITVRTLETLIRLATSHAKCRLSKFVTEEDAQAAIDLVQYACFKEVLRKEKRKTRPTDSSFSEADDAKRIRVERSDSSMSEGPDEEPIQSTIEITSTVELSPSVMSGMREALSDVFHAEQALLLPLDVVRQRLCEKWPLQVVEAALAQLNADNEIAIAEDSVMLF